MTTLHDSVRYLKGIGPKRLDVFERLGIKTIENLLYYLPRDYEDRTRVTPIGKLRAGERATVRGRVVAAEKYRSGRGRAMARVLLEDASGELTCVWFRAQYFREENFPAGREMFFSGKVDFYKGPQMVSPQHELADEGEALFGPRILPIYPLTEKLNQTSLRRIMKATVDKYAHLLEDLFEPDYLKKRNFPSLADAIRVVHFPETLEDASRARRRLAYDEMFLLEMGMAVRRRDVRREHAGFAFDVSDKIAARIRRRFPFKLTAAQENAVEEIRGDMRQDRAMNRILQGDVGSGKTVVALYAMLAAVANRFQSAIMAPTEILAAQHAETIRRYLKGSRVRTALLAGGLTRKKRAEEVSRIASGEADIVIGTHALVQGDVEFKNLGMVVVDEQHKFGVLQRAALRQKGHHPDVLVMTATPIPRTLSLTIFGDLDVSIIDEMPPGRQPIQTEMFARRNVSEAYALIGKRVQAGEQAFVVYPLVEESESSDLTAAISGREHLQKKIFPDLHVGLLHGRMRSDEKDQVMREFRAGRYQILVSTIIVEVGIDIPNATAMLVEHAERFGLAQLHQLRGRIGRGERSSHFLLLGSPKNEDARKRLRVICSTSDGFRIAEEDLKIRGPGEFFGTRQHGLPELHVADILGDYRLLQMARRDAFDLVKSDPQMSEPGHRKVYDRMENMFADRLDLIHVG